MRRKHLRVLLLLLSIIFTTVCLRTQQSLASKTSMGSSSETATAPLLPALGTPTVPSPIPSPALATVASTTNAPGASEQRAFRFLLNRDELTLEAIEDVRGHFRARRGPLGWLPGMLCCRLLDSDQRVLAEETVPAPDHSCVVLDANAETGQSQLVALTAPGPVVFQVRLPNVPSASEMRVYRLMGERLADANAEPVGQLLATIPLSQ